MTDRLQVSHHDAKAAKVAKRADAPVDWFGLQPAAWQESPDRGGSIALWRLESSEPAGFTAEPLRDAHLVCVHLVGTMNWSAQLNDRSYRAPCNANTFCVARAGETAEVEYSDARLSFAQFFLPVRWFESDLVDAASSRCGNAIELIDPMNASCHAVSGLARKAVRAMRSAGTSARLLIDEILIDLSAALVERHSSAVPSQPARGGLSPAVVRRVVDYMQAHLAEEVQLVELARLAHVTVPHFCRAFAKSTGAPPHRYQIAIRLEKATRLLAEPGLSIADVAFAVGYEDPSYFSRLFGYQAGMSPSEWRKEFLK